MSLLSAAERIAAMDRSEVVFDARRCLHTRGKASECEACFEICPAGAILPGKPPTLNPLECQTCLACLPVCPTGAYAADDAVSALFNAVAHLEGGSVELLCENNPHPELGMAEATGITVKHCLAGLGMGAYIALAAFDIEKLHVRTEYCYSCKWSALSGEVESQTNHANTFLAGWGKPGFVEAISDLINNSERPYWSAESPPVSRRDLFRMMARQGKTVMARAMERGQTDTERRPGRDRMRVINSAQALPSAAPEAEIDLGQFGYAAVSVTDECTACSACARVCPTGALSFTTSAEPARFSLQFTARKCIDCGICSAVCSPSAIELNHQPTFAGVFAHETVPLIESSLGQCDRCGASFAQHHGVKLCPLCDFRRQNPFGSQLPAGYLRGQTSHRKESAS